MGRVAHCRQERAIHKKLPSLTLARGAPSGVRSSYHANENFQQGPGRPARADSPQTGPARRLADALGAERLPKWVKTGSQTTDGHLVALAAAHGSILATLDRGIPGAFVIPED